MTYMDSQTIRGNGSAVANTESSLGVINIASGQRWKLFSTWVGTAGGGGGTYRWSISTYPQAEFAFVQEGLADVSIATATADTHATRLDTVIIGPASLECFISNVAAGVASTARITYIAEGGPTN